jgi:uncharacterized repeat protein (TIGR01451 family)/CSLREA domain-containing protein
VFMSIRGALHRIGGARKRRLLLEPLEDRCVLAATISINDPASVVEGNSGTTNLTFTVTISEAPSEPVTVDFSTADNTAKGLVVDRVASGLARPVFVTAPPGDMNRLFVLEQHAGTIRILDRSTNPPTLLSTSFLNIPDGVSTGNEQGLLGLAFHPNFATNGFFYVNYTDPAGNTQIRRFTRSEGDPNVADPTSGQAVLSIAQPQSNHNGGWIGFGPDGFLYIASGDGGGGDDNDSGHTADIGNGQDKNSLLGKILRINVNSDQFPTDAAKNYAIPATNPFSGATAGADEVWSYGLRNPWRPSFDRQTGDFWIADVGQNAREEVNFQYAYSRGGENYGWRLREGTIATPSGGVGGAKPTGAIDPIYDYTRGIDPASFQGFAVTGGYVYRGPIAELRGQYFFGDNVSEGIWSLRFAGSSALSFNGTQFTNRTNWTSLFNPDAGARVINSIASFGEDPAGNLFIVDLTGEIYQITNGADFDTLSGQVTFTPTGPLTQTITVRVIGDILDEPGETFFVNLSNPRGTAVIAKGQGIGTIQEVDQADLSLTMSDDLDPVTAREIVSYTVNVTNNGPSASGQIMLVDTLPPGASLTSVVTNGVWTCNPTTGAVSCTRPPLAAGASSPITLRLRAPDPAGPITNSVSVSSTISDPVTDNNTVTETTAVVPAVCSFVVTNTNDSGTGSLREAILCSNASEGVLDTITFNIPTTDAGFVDADNDDVRDVGDYWSIRPPTALPAIIDPVIIDGYTQPGAAQNSDPLGFNGTLLIEINRNVGPEVFLLNGSGSTIRGFVINGNGNATGISIKDGSNNFIQGNFIGTNPAGTASIPNHYGIDIVGLSAAASDNVIGGAEPAHRNLISGNSQAGIRINAPTATAENNIVRGNFIGTNAFGTAALGNSIGIAVYNNASGTTIGGRLPGESNVVSGNLNGGIDLGGSQITCGSLSQQGTGTSGSIVQGNKIGTDVTGTQPLGNGKNGITVGFTSNSTNAIGGTVGGAGNIIAFNGLNGIGLISGQTSVLGNSIFSNNQLGLNLGAGCGVAPNDADDSDIGPNNFQNFPEIREAKLGGGQLSISYVVPSPPTHSTYPLRIEFFKADANGQEGQTFLGFDTYLENEAGTTKFVLFTPAAVVAVSDKLVATATDNAAGGGNTSEFSASAIIIEICSLIVTTTADNENADDGVTSLREAINCANDTPNFDRDGEPGDDPDPIRFNIPVADLGHVYYADDGVAGQVSRDTVTATTAASDTALVDADPDWPHSWWSIQLLGSLPSINLGVTIDGYTQTGAKANTSPASRGEGLNTVLRIEIQGIPGSQVDSIGLIILPNNGPGGVTVRGLAVNNVEQAIRAFADDGVFEGNFIGTDISGTTLLQTVYGLTIEGSSNQIGGIDAADRNLIAGEAIGLLINSSGEFGATDNVVQGNLIGTDVTATKTFFEGYGIALTGLFEEGKNFDNIIGGGAPDARNVISGLVNGIWISGGHDNLIEGNDIGVRTTGNSEGIFSTGILISGSGNAVAEGNIVVRNRIAFHTVSGVVISESARNNAILENAIFSNGGLGIDLGDGFFPPDDDFTPNDPGDSDSGANNQQNFPEISAATRGAGKLRVTYRVPSNLANSTYPLRVEFFKADSDGQEGERFLGFDIFTAADFAAGLKTVTIAVAAPIANGDKLVATATDSLPTGGLANTSEFSPAATIVNPWNNLTRTLDVRGGDTVIPDNFVDAGDALAVINYLNSFDATEVPADAEKGLPFGYLDTNDDGYVAPEDALSVINAINSGLGGEGEAKSRFDEDVLALPQSGELPFNELIGLLARDIAAPTKRRR